MAPPVMGPATSLAAAAALALLLLLASAAPSAAQDAGVPSEMVFRIPSLQPAEPAKTRSGLAAFKLDSTETADAAGATVQSAAGIQDRTLELPPEAGSSLLDAIGAPAPAQEEADIAAAASYAPESGDAGASGYSFSDTRLGRSASAFAPFVRPAGKLYMTFPDGNYVCSGSLIGKSLVVTAAHCLVDFGSVVKASKVSFSPNYDATSTNNSWFKAIEFVVPESYIEGTDTCDVDDETPAGVVCSNDLALVWLDVDKNGRQAYQAAGGRYYNYLVNAFQATKRTMPGEASRPIPKYLAITQLDERSAGLQQCCGIPSRRRHRIGRSYPAAWDKGGRMQMSNSPGFEL
ncbi:hypothetical protein Rsub_05558 [Raphidocelis subcapitata]|uniref:Peptidase S1 domain-containing protein n=1 Tax=Raphidocelis subcapitata TaxID=307507 RepID=A0A2V0NXK8_9CHLO|nr:hypothetical protein Rsub_05558 [Raphidocelis subcapitata]|eukprot:GBF92356.1 hypothetical protein Rsub_05558 [Raphidocelis subcapitata]